MLAAHLVLDAVINRGSINRADQDWEEEALYEGVKNLADEEQGTWEEDDLESLCRYW